MYNKDLKINLAALGEDAEVATTYNNMGKVYDSPGQYDERWNAQKV